MNQTETRKIRVYGIVQGVGFRPTVSRHAVKNDIHGSVCNKGPYVEIFAQGTKAQVDGFLEDLEKRPPKRAAILKINVEHLDNNPEFDGFEIIESEKTKGEIFVSPDIAICDECKEELYDPNNRRYLHPFINCTCCGPRLTILDALPYDRERTSMKEFPMCSECAEEYNNPESRRFDAQPVCCNDCGPEVYLIGRDERGREAITYTRKVIASGGIAAIKGIGGFHLCCDATNETAVARLRELKRRPMKPFAIMARDMSAVRKECQVTEVQEEVLDGHQKPILLLERLDKADSQICPSVAPGNPKIGVMLPYAPVQLLIFDYDDGIQMPDYLVMTSGNTSGAPICRDDNDAIAELSHLCDCMLSHNRKIRIRADDSVMDYYKDEPYMIRRSRGYAPLPVMVSAPWKGQVLAVGGELKNSFCIGVDGRFYLSPYVGDLEDLRTVNALRETIGRLETLLEVEPPVVVSDMHPRYNSTMIAEESGLPVIKVQHHYAHILSCMAENDCQEPVIGVSFDGTGYGMDGTIWGGEILLADYKAFQRFGCITPFLQIGGDASSREGWRVAVSMLYGQMKDRAAAMTMIEKLNLCSVQDAKVQMAMADRKINAVMSTSAGRLFDGVSAILGIRKASTFEGEASMALEFTAEAYEKKHQNAVDLQHAMDEMRKQIPLAVCIDNKESESTEKNKPEQVKAVLNTDALVKTIAEARLAGADTEKLAYFFHWILAEEIIVACQKARKESGRGTVALSGGVFQNQLLLKMVDEGLQKEGFKVLRHRLVPPNDGGIALGQAVYAMGALKS
ncbi:carbamoyltransferase HypF [Coprococcus catus]|uniref:carbamoyltransferase HypF n=1 Tax=Coprococcus catus TaxID=116085 RepID=UPI001C01DAB6|nr:carbamoyltransferase HypF [Coprococcus catus]MBT9769990.1 carbamoyltransferase HypF [Coprococcus catus]